MATKSGWNNRGCLSLFYDDAGLQVQGNSKEAKPNKSNPTQSKMSYEPGTRINDTDEILRMEPSLRFQERQPTSAIYQEQTSAASSERFTQELARRCEKSSNVNIMYGTSVHGIKVSDDGRTIAQIQTNRGVIDISPDTQVVVAAGAWTSRILSFADLYVPVYPLTGYAISMSAKKSALRDRDLPSRIVCDKYMFTSRLGPDEIRMTSIGKFS